MAGDFGRNIELSADGNTLAVGSVEETNDATGINGNQASGTAASSGAVYVFVRDPMGGWSQQAYVKASNTGSGDRFGQGLALSDDGNTLAVGAEQEDSGATGIGGNQGNGTAPDSGAVYVFVRDPMGQWSQQAYVKASNTDADDRFGLSVALSGSGDVLVVGAHGEDGSTSGIGGAEADDSASSAGAAYVFVRDPMGAWSREAYVKASNAAQGDAFGEQVAISGDADTLAVAAPYEAGGAAGIGGDQSDDSLGASGAVYVY